MRSYPRSIWPALLIVLRALRTKRGHQHRHACANVGRVETAARSADGPATSARCGSQSTMRAPMPINLSTKNSRDSNIFSCIMNQSLALRCRNDGDGHGIGRECRPRLILQLRHVIAEVRLNLTALLGGNDEVIAFDLDTRYPSRANPMQRRTEMLDARRLDANLASA